VGIDIFLHDRRAPAELGPIIQALQGDRLELNMLASRGVMVWPRGQTEFATADHWCGRYLARTADGTITHQDVIGLLQRANDAGLDVIKTEYLCKFDGQPGYTLGQGQ
jgi:isocitrate dehydrogenase